MTRGYTKDEIDELPMYWACLQIGALSKDKTNLKLSDTDAAHMASAIAERNSSRG